MCRNAAASLNFNRLRYFWRVVETVSRRSMGFRREGYQIVSNSETARSLASLVMSGAR